MTTIVTKRTDELVPGDRVILPNRLVRTVREITPSQWVNAKNETIYYVMYREGGTAEWSAGNSAIARSEWKTEVASS